MSELYNRIDELCRKNNINITIMCKACGVSRSSLTDLKMHRVKSLSATVLSRIADYFSVTVEYLMGGEPKTDLQKLKFALFGGDGDITDEMWDEVRRYAMYIKERENGNK